ncbi:hypothetical protein HDV01_004716 [Terramyces sp. JEL0728]|nr:hypothetical protein HDV01_004716 [Terramyces sp. JEL0728]
MNAFFFYRSKAKHDIEETCSTTNSNEISRVAAIRWKNEPDEVKKVYQDMSKKAYDAFKIKHPDFEWNKKKKPSEYTDRRLLLPKRNAKLKKDNQHIGKLDFQDSKDAEGALCTDSQTELKDKLLPETTNEILFFTWLSQISNTNETEPDMNFDELVVSFIREFNPNYGVDFEDLVDSCIRELNPCNYGTVAMFN